MCLYRTIEIGKEQTNTCPYSSVGTVAILNHIGFSVRGDLSFFFKAEEVDA